MLASITHGRNPQNVTPVTVEGSVFRGIEGGLYVQLANKNTYELKAAKRHTLEDLNHLENGDHIIGLGQTNEKTIVLEELEMVGVKKIVGTWRDSTNRKQFRFLDFTTLNITENITDNNAAPYTKSNRVRSGEHLNYRLVPDKKNEWAFFLTSNSPAKTGTLKYNDRNQLIIQLLDLDTGQVNEEYFLTLIK